MGLMNKVPNGVNEARAPKEHSFTYLGAVVQEPINANPRLTLIFGKTLY